MTFRSMRVLNHHQPPLMKSLARKIQIKILTEEVVEETITTETKTEISAMIGSSSEVETSGVGVEAAGTMTEKEVAVGTVEEKDITEGHLLHHLLRKGEVVAITIITSLREAIITTQSRITCRGHLLTLAIRPGKTKTWAPVAARTKKAIVLT